MRNKTWINTKANIKIKISNNITLDMSSIKQIILAMMQTQKRNTLIIPTIMILCPYCQWITHISISICCKTMEK